MTVPRSEPTPPCAEPRPDGCGECVINVEEPYLHEHVGDSCRCAYECADCGHRWTTNWGCA